MKTARLSDTSAAVTTLAGSRIHTSAPALRYLDMLDLSGGRDLIRLCMEVWPHLDQLVQNRKMCILGETIKCLSAGINQVVILGSGLDSLSLEIASQNREARVYELDTVNMDIKQALVRKAFGGSDGRICCLDADLRDSRGALAAAAAAGWDAHSPSVIILEGISYYVSEHVLWDLMGAFGTYSENHILLEYIVPRYRIDKERAHIPGMVFDIIRKNISDPPKITFLDPDHIRDVVTKMNGSVVHRHTMQSIELERIGTNRHFPTEQSGWVEVAHILVKPTDSQDGLKSLQT